jgi:hypothetical protein
LNSVVEHNLGSSRAVLRFDCMHPIASKAGASRRRRRVCDRWAARLPCLRRCPRAAAMEGVAKRVLACSLGQFSQQEGGLPSDLEPVLAECKALAIRLKSRSCSPQLL